MNLFGIRKKRKSLGYKVVPLYGIAVIAIIWTATVLLPPRVYILQSSASDSRVDDFHATIDKRYVATVTAYSEKDSCHYPTESGCLMANGEIATFGYIACPREIPLGTKVRIFNRVYECGDRLSERIVNTFDVWMGYGEESYNRAVEFGKQELQVVVL